MKDRLFDDHEPKPANWNYASGERRGCKVIADYVYQDEHGEPYLRVERTEDKQFPQSYWNGKCWMWGKPNGPKIPYYLPSLAKLAPDVPVFITEGEKDADAVTDLGLEATCASEGAGKWTSDLNKWFEGRHQVFILADNDQAGRKHAELVARNLAPIVRDVRIVVLPGLAEHGDVSDWIAAGGTSEQLLELCYGAPPLKPRVVIREGDSVAIVDAAEVALLAANVEIFQRGGELVRPVVLDRPVVSASVNRPEGAAILIAVRETWLTEQFARHLQWVRLAKTKEGQCKEVPADPKLQYAKTLLSRAGEWKAPVLRGMLNTPVLDADGRMIQRPGYDAASGLLLNFDEGAYPPIPEAPSRADAERALNDLARPIRSFPFDNEASKAVALSALLTAIIRPSLMTAPLHAFDAPMAGTGKSMLAEMAGLLATGVRPPAMSQGKSAEEDEKRLSTVLHAGDRVILIDNCEQSLGGDFLCSMLTQVMVQARILGRSERRILPSTALIMATGNNLTLEGDIARRAVICRLDAKQERPDQRVFDFDAQQELIADRARLVVAGLTALRAYKLSGYRPANMTPMGSFADWDWVRGTLIWTGHADPAESRSALFDEDPLKAERVQVMDLWEKEFGDCWVSVAQISGRPPDNALRQALGEICGNGQWNAKKAGWWLRHQKDRIVGGKAFQQDKQSGKWQLRGATQGSF
jgi:hypothetical protein